MGCTTSAEDKHSKLPHSELPVDASKYEPPVEYMFIDVPVKLSVQGVFGVELTSDVDAYYPILSRAHREALSLLQFNMIPGTVARDGAFSRSMTFQFQGIFARMSDTQPVELHVVKSVISPQFMQTGFTAAFSTVRETVTDTSHLILQGVQNYD
ncbi:uncharacterized protein LOC144433176 [Glandiceps talaboti]